MREQSIRGVLKTIMPLLHKPAPNGLEYLSETIGLDQKYIRDYVNPVISSNYLHNVNSVAILFKLLPLYCKNYDAGFYFSKEYYDKKNSQVEDDASGKKNHVLVFD